MDAPGQLVSVNDTRMHVYRTACEPQSAHETLVFLSGWGTPCPTYDFKPLWSILANRFAIAVVERPGYGWSEPTERPRGIDTLVEETRAALGSAGASGPFAVVCHSIAGLVALRWAQRYPEEISAIVGLDMAVPQVYESMSYPRTLTALARLAHLLRKPIASVATKGNPACKKGLLDDAELASMRAATARQLLSRNVLEEAACTKQNARTVAADGCPDARVLCLLSSDKGLRRQIPAWGQAHRAYFASNGETEFVELPCGHYIHGELPEQAAREIALFLG